MKFLGCLFIVLTTSLTWAGSDVENENPPSKKENTKRKKENPNSEIPKLKIIGNKARLNALFNLDMEKLSQELEAHILQDDNFLLSLQIAEAAPKTNFQIRACHDCNKKVIGLALDGGGIRGIMEAYILKYIEAMTGKKIHELFDVIAGTSTGGLIAAAIGMPSEDNDGTSLYNAHQITNFYIEDAAEIFSKSKNPLAKGAILKAKYKDGGIENFLEKRFTKTLRLSDMVLPILLTGYDSNAKKLKLYSSVNSYLKTSHDSRIFEATRVTAAAPTFFKSVAKGSDVNLDHKIKKKEVLRDGGIIANNPSMQLYEEIQRLFPGKKEEDIIILSLGAGKPKKSKSHKNMGKIDAGEIVQDFMNAQMAEVDRQMKTKLGKNYLRIQVPLKKALLDRKSTRYITIMLEAALDTLKANALIFKNLKEVWHLQEGKHGSSYDQWRLFKTRNSDATSIDELSKRLVSAQ
jgi:patatin-like phospholipase/acyl hydrolase